MSNRLSFAHLVPHREPHEFLAAPAAGFAASALRWLRDVAATDDMPQAMRRDLGLPATRDVSMSFAYEIERSRVRV
jgi:hypothetical protein